MTGVDGGDDMTGRTTERTAYYRAYAKVNLTLEILGRRADGFHDLASLVQTVALADELSVSAADELSCVVEGMELHAEDNLVLRAARALARELEVEPRAHVRLCKRIPAAAGLGGGSSDAAATLVALARLWRRRPSQAALARLAADLGSDVPFFRRGGTAVMRGRGDVIEPLERPARGWLVLLVPSHDVADKTATLYRALSPSDFTDGEATRRAVAVLATGRRLEAAELRNGFGHAARTSFPGLDEVWERAERLAGRRFHLSGAGPALFALAESASDAHAAAGRLAALGTPVFSCRFVGEGHRRCRISYP